jgi:HPr kinase/phosphorylase
MTLKHETVTADRLLHESRLASLAFHLVAGETGLSRQVTNPRLQKPGLALAGFLEYVKPGRVQVIGFSEAQFLTTLSPATVTERVDALVGLEPPLIVVTQAMEPTAGLFAPA